MKQKSLIPTIISIVFIAIIWQFTSLCIAVPSIFPSLSDLIIQIYKLIIGSDFLINISITIFRGFCGFAVAFILGISFASIASFSAFWKAFFQPIIIITRSVPIISFVLIAMLWFSPPYLPMYIAVITMFPIIYQNTLSGFEHTDIRLIEMAKVFGKSPLKRYFSINLPSSKKMIFDGISTSMGFGWRAIIIGEALSQPLHGIGSAMKQSQVYFNVSELMAWTIVAIAISYFFEWIIKGIQKISLHKKMNITTKNKSVENTQIAEIKIIDITKINKRIENTQIAEIKIIDIININKHFNDKQVIKNYTITFDSENVNCIKGISGKGKTTLLRLISKLENVDNGTISVNKNYSLAYCFQDIRLFPWLTVYENIAFGINSTYFDKKKNASQIYNLIERMELTEHVDKYPNELSGGQQQRVGLLRALVAQSDVLLLDEPLTGLDDNLKKKIIEILSLWISEHHPIVIWATHENIVFENLKVRDIIL